MNYTTNNDFDTAKPTPFWEKPIGTILRWGGFIPLGIIFIGIVDSLALMIYYWINFLPTNWMIFLGGFLAMAAMFTLYGSYMAGLFTGHIIPNRVIGASIMSAIVVYLAISSIIDYYSDVLPEDNMPQIVYAIMKTLYSTLFMVGLWNKDEV